MKKVNHGIDVPTHIHNELPASSQPPPPIYVLKHVCTRLILLFGGKKQSQDIKIAGTGQLAVGIRPLDCKYTFLSFPKMLTAVTTRTGREGGGGGEKEGMGVNGLVIITNIIYIYFINQYYARGLSLFIALLISFVSYFQICNSLFSIGQLYASFSAFLSGDPAKLEIVSVSLHWPAD